MGDYNLSIKVEKDNNEIKCISILRKNINKSISDIKSCINNNYYILSCDLTDIDELLDMKKLVNILLESSIKVHLYENDVEVDIVILDNYIKSHLDTLKYLQEIDDKMLNED